MSTIPQIRTAIAAAIDGVGDLRAHATYPGQIVPPAAVVRRRFTAYGAAFDGSPEHRMAVTVYLSLADYSTAQTALDALLSETGAGSLVAALRLDPSFGGVVSSSTVISAEEEGQTSGDPAHLSGTVTLTVRA